MKKFIVFSLGLLAGGVMAAHAADAKAIWTKECAKCHGVDGKGKTTMGKKLEVKDYSDPKNQADLKDEKMAKSIKEGIKDGDKTRMKPFGEMLSDSEVKALVAYFRGLKK
jgi:mono/diheme cytochrome c family protein